MKKDEADPLIKLMMPNLIEARKSHGKCKRERRRVLSGLKEILRECLDTFDELALRKMKHKLTKFDAYKSVNRAHKDLHGRISRVRKVVQSVSVRKGLDSGEDSSIATRDEDTIEPLVERSIVKHLRRTGQRDVADTLLRDHDEKDEEDKDRFAKLVKLMEACESRDLSFLLRWTSENSDAIRDGALYSDIEFRLQSMKFREIAREKSATDAIQYARTEMRVYCKHAPGKMQELMTSLLFLSSSDGEEEEEEKDIVNNDDATWTCIREDIRKCACKLMGIPFRCPLRTAVQAGILVTPTLKKFKSVVRDSAYGTKQNWHEEDLSVVMQLPVTFQYHSVFVCPVSHEQTDEKNPPMLLKCGHAVSRNAMERMCATQYWSSRRGAPQDATRIKFKCPYCGEVQSKANARKLIFS